MKTPGNLRCCQRTENAIFAGGLVIAAAIVTLGLAFSRNLKGFIPRGESVPSGVVRILAPAADAAGADR